MEGRQRARYCESETSSGRLVYEFSIGEAKTLGRLDPKIPFRFRRWDAASTQGIAHILDPLIILGHIPMPSHVKRPPLRQGNGRRVAGGSPLALGLDEGRILDEGLGPHPSIRVGHASLIPTMLCTELLALGALPGERGKDGERGAGPLDMGMGLLTLRGPRMRSPIPGGITLIRESGKDRVQILKGDRNPTPDQTGPGHTPPAFSCGHRCPARRHEPTRDHGLGNPTVAGVQDMPLSDGKLSRRHAGRAALRG
jgi:hypothetical protein